MMQFFFSAQKTDKISQTQKKLALLVAETFGRKKKTTAEYIVTWENLWVEYEIIPGRKAAERYNSWMTDKDVIMTIWEFTRKKSDSTYQDFFFVMF